MRLFLFIVLILSTLNEPAKLELYERKNPLMKTYCAHTLLLLIVLTLFSRCSTFNKIEITDHYYIRVPNKAIKHFSFSVYSDVDYQGGITYRFTNDTDSSEIVLANHPFPEPTHFIYLLPNVLKKLQKDSIQYEYMFTWSGNGYNFQCLYDNYEDKYAIVPPHTYWEARLVSKPHFAPNLNWYFIGFHNVPKNKVRLYKKVFYLKRYRKPLKKHSPWAPLFSQSNIDNIYKEY